MKYVVLGASAAGISAAKELRKINNKKDEIVLISTDENVYSRCILHHYLGDTRTVEELNFVENDFEKRYHIIWKKGITCTGIEVQNKMLLLSDGSKESYDSLLIATGAHVMIPPIKGIQNTKNVVGFRNLDDVEFIKEKLPTSKNIVILGGGLVGVDALTGLLHQGKTPVLVELADRLLVRQLDHEASTTYSKAFEEKGITFYFKTGMEEIIKDENGAVESVVLSDGTTLPCDLLILTAGVRSNIEFLQGSGVETDRFGLLINEKGETNIPGIYGAGDVTGRSPIWPAAVKQGLIAAANMSGKERYMDDFFASKSTMNFMGIATMSLGICEMPDDSYQETVELDAKSYKKIIHKNGKIYGAILQGELSYAGVLTQLIAHKIDITKVKKPIFNIDYSDFFHVDKNFEYYYDEERENG
jgi:NAD(P)H-nitrite reductase large subunit